MFGHVPKDIKLEIFSFFSAQTLALRVAPVCKEWQALSESAQLWAYLLLKDYSVQFNPNDASTYGTQNPRTIYKLLKTSLLSETLYAEFKQSIMHYNQIFEESLVNATNQNILYLDINTTCDQKLDMITNENEFVRMQMETLLARNDEVTNMFLQDILESLAKLLDEAMQNHIKASILINEITILNRPLLLILLKQHADILTEVNLSNQEPTDTSYILLKLSSVNATKLRTLHLPTTLFTRPNAIVPYLKKFINLDTIKFTFPSVQDRDVVSSSIIHKLLTDNPKAKVIIEYQDDKREKDIFTSESHPLTLTKSNTSKAPT